MAADRKLIRNTYYCPITKSALFQANEGLVRAFNRWVREEEVLNFGGEQVHVMWDALLVNEKRDTAYPILGKIPQLLPMYAISLKGLRVGNPVD